ncbi:MAG: ATP-binding protein, partial [archaeon]
MPEEQNEPSIYETSEDIPSAIETSIEEKDNPDMFDDVFGEDEEKKEARKKMSEKAKELKKKKVKPEIQSITSEEGEEGKAKKAKPEGKDDSDEKEDPEDEDEEIEEDGTENVEPQIFTDSDKEEAEEAFESKDETIENQEAGMINKKKNKNSDFENTIKEGMEKSIKKGMGGGKLDIQTIVDETEEEIESENERETDPIERKIIKSVIKNKATKAAKEQEDADNEDEMADLLFEDGTKEDGVVGKKAEAQSKEIEEETDVEEDNEEAIMARKAKGEAESEEEGDDDGKGIKPKLSFLMSETKHAYIGRKKSVLSKYGDEAGLYLGKVYEKDMEGADVYLDGLNPHVVFVCGARGSGKSYVLGVVAEELAMKNKNVGIVVVDPIGVFWSMKHPNKEDKELEALAKWGIMPTGLSNVKVFIPVGMKDQVPKSTFDAVFSIQPALLTAEDWCLTFGIDRFSPTGLLMEKGLSKVKKGYTNHEGKPVRGKENTFSLEDLIKCYENDEELNNAERGYKADSIRALASRFDAAKHWGIFDEKGTALGLLSRAGQMTILDTSFLEDNVSALVIGILSRRILSARKLGTRREAAGKFSDTDVEELMEINIPPTWLFIDEAHTLIPAGNQKTPASNALVEYVKQGRRPGCSLVFATQQPSAIDSKVLSQLDVIMAHKLVFDDDIKSIHKRTPAIIPFAYKKPNFIKTMPVGIALTGDRSETTSRAFIMS